MYICICIVTFSCRDLKKRKYRDTAFFFLCWGKEKMIWKTKRKRTINKQPPTNRNYLTCSFCESSVYATVLHRLLPLLLHFSFPIENMEDSKRIYNSAGVGKENNQDQVE